MKLAAYMEAKKLSVRKFAATLGVAHMSVQRWKTGDALPSLEQAFAIQQATRGRVKPADFLKGDEG